MNAPPTMEDATCTDLAPTNWKDSNVDLVLQVMTSLLTFAFHKMSMNAR